MARPPKIEPPRGLHHVTSRGNYRDRIYPDDFVRVLWLELLGRVCERFNWICHAYCLIDNQHHIVVETVKGNLSKGMRQLNGLYTQYFNRTHNPGSEIFVDKMQPHMKSD
ncbi:Transposase IS200 like [Nitrosomonas cryotolerans]|uniref:transposase n=1 Tax=Nitrosomonas cryotolerans TaxID=44575 RepID=UPI00049012CC|nr:transposase [Nitrosomonas cryotolerans]SFP92014.1 Transposase IS200 like [Nitrosomonas cryotolerans]